MRSIMSTLGAIMGLWVMSSGVSASAEDVIARFVGTGPAKTAPFRVDVPWLLSWTATGEFPQLANLEIKLYDAATDEFAGLLVQHSGLGRGQKLVRAAGRYRISVVGCCVDWSIEVEEASDSILKAIGDNERITELRLVDPDSGLSRQVMERISGWQAGPGANELTLRTSDGGSLRASFHGACNGLQSTEGINFVTSRRRYEYFTSILLDDGTRCYFDRIR